jgi:hypothetical protein
VSSFEGQTAVVSLSPTSHISPIASLNVVAIACGEQKVLETGSKQNRTISVIRF